MVLSKIDQTIQDDYFFNLCNYLSKNDLVIFNNTKVIPARLYGSKSTGGKGRNIFERKISDYDFLAFIKNFKLLDSKNEIIISNTQKVIVEKKIGDFYHIRSDKTTTVHMNFWIRMAILHCLHILIGSQPKAIKIDTKLYILVK